MTRTLPSILIAISLTPLPLLADSHSNRAETSHLAASPTRKLETDETLRVGMSTIAGSLRTHWESIRGSRLKSADYMNLEKGIRAAIADIVAKCKLSPDSDRAFHEILQDMNRGLDLMNSPRLELQRAGALAVGQATRNYGKYFDHPGWSPPFVAP